MSIDVKTAQIYVLKLCSMVNEEYIRIHGIEFHRDFDKESMAKYQEFLKSLQDLCEKYTVALEKGGEEV